MPRKVKFGVYPNLTLTDFYKKKWGKGPPPKKEKKFPPEKKFKLFFSSWIFQFQKNWPTRLLPQKKTLIQKCQINICLSWTLKQSITCYNLYIGCHNRNTVIKDLVKSNNSQTFSYLTHCLSLRHLEKCSDPILFSKISWLISHSPKGVLAFP